MEGLNLKDLYRILLKRWWIPVACTLLFTIIAGATSFFLMTPVYQSNTTLYIGQKPNQNSPANQSYNDILMNTQLVKDYRELVKSRMVAGAVIDNLKLNGMTADKLANKLAVNLKNDTRVIQITAEDADPAMAMKIANTVADVFSAKAVEIMKVENVNIIDRATLPNSPVKPNKKLNIIIAFILGVAVGIGVEILIEYLDNTVKTPEDVKRYLDLPVIGTIPVFPE